MQRPHITTKLRGLIDGLGIGIERAASARQEFVQTSKLTESLLKSMSSWLLAMRIHAGLVDYEIARSLESRVSLDLDLAPLDLVSERRTKSMAVQLRKLEAETETEIETETDTEVVAEGIISVHAEPDEVVRQLEAHTRLKRPTRISRLLKKPKTHQKS